MIYCIDCESVLTKVLEHQVYFNGYHLTEYSNHLEEWFTCDGPFTYSAPLDVPLQNVQNLVAPDEEFMAISDANAESLLLGFV